MLKARVKLIIYMATLAMVLFTQTTASAKSYADQTRDALKRVFGKSDFPDWVFRGNPVGAFGVGTVYEDAPKVPVENRWLLGTPDTWFADTVPQSQVDTWMKRIIVTGDFGSVTLNDNDTKHVDASLVLSNLLSVLGINFTHARHSSVKVALTADSAVNRRLNWTAFKEAVDAGVIRPSVVTVIRSGKFVMCAADIEFSGYNLTIDASHDANVDAQLAAKSKATMVVGDESTIRLQVSSSGAGTYVVKALTPVVAAVLFKAPPGGIGLNALTDPNAQDITKWPAVDISTALDATHLKPHRRTRHIHRK